MMSGPSNDNAAPAGNSRRIQDLYLRPLAEGLRRRRFRLIRSLISRVPRPVTVLDVGGTEFFWQQVGFTGDDDLRIVLLNLTKEPVTRPNFRSVIGDATQMPEFPTGEFDVVFSNSVIEHVGGYEQQRRMADEVRRVGKRYCIQTPNRYFPIEPHFLIPFLQFYPMWLQVLLTRHLDVGSYGKFPDREAAEAYLGTLRLMTEPELRALFPGARIHEEKVFGLTKSFVVYSGWDPVA
jgi:Methyltransferase domain